eukprot:scaffold297_cov386-Prasinococcus_capsulatus_cf.AAC.13
MLRRRGWHMQRRDSRHRTSTRPMDACAASSCPRHATNDGGLLQTLTARSVAVGHAAGGGDNSSVVTAVGRGAILIAGGCNLPAALAPQGRGAGRPVGGIAYMMRRWPTTMRQSVTCAGARDDLRVQRDADSDPCAVWLPGRREDHPSPAPSGEQGRTENWPRR